MEQHGFQHKRNTTSQINRLVKHIKASFNNKMSSTEMVLLDVKKAFDRVWHDVLIYKLIKFKFPRYLIIFLKSYLQNRKFFVTVKK
jgi:hypothetical protein